MLVLPPSGHWVVSPRWPLQLCRSESLLTTCRGWGYPRSLILSTPAFQFLENLTALPCAGPEAWGGCHLGRCQLGRAGTFSGCSFFVLSLDFHFVDCPRMKRQLSLASGPGALGTCTPTELEGSQGHLVHPVPSEPWKLRPEEGQGLPRVT